MSQHDAPGRRRVFVPHALGADEFLRVTWHETRELVVFSHWSGDRCVAAIPVRASDVGEVAALADDAAVVPSSWPAPRSDEMVVPATGFSTGPVAHIA